MIRSTNDIIIAARRHVIGGAAVQEASARVCLTDAVGAHDSGDYPAAALRAVKSLAYSVGIYHRDYKAAHAFVVRSGWLAAHRHW